MRRFYLAVASAAAMLAVAACSDTTTSPRDLRPTRHSTLVPEGGLIYQSNLTGVAACDAEHPDEWHWVINGLASDAGLPDHITAHFNTAGDISVPFVKFVGGVAHYATTEVGADDYLIAPYAEAVLTAGTFYLRFNLSHMPCGGGGSVAESFVVTEIHLADHTVVSDAAPSLAGAIVHDKATVTINPNTVSIPAGSTVEFYFWNNLSCDGTPIAGPDSRSISGASGSSAESGTQGPLAAGSYGFKALFVSGDPKLVADGEGTCEPLTIAPAGKTMGFWGNTNGQNALLVNGYAANAVNIGRGVTVSTQAQSLKTLPSTLNACGKSTTTFVYNTVSNQNCTVAAGINVGTLNTAGAQTLAFGYNILITWAGYNGITLGSAGCGATAVGTLTGSSTLAQILGYAQGVLTGTISGPTTQGQVGSLNVVLNCMNKEF